MRRTRPIHVSTNLAVSMDGKISTSGRVHTDPTPYDSHRMDFHRSCADAIVIGATTLRVFRLPMRVREKRHVAFRRKAGMPAHPVNVVLTRHPDFNLSWPFFRDPEIERVLVVPASTPEAKLKRFRSCALILKYREGRSLPEQVIAFLEKLGCKRLLLEGGGSIMFPWVERDLIDTWNVTLSPKIIGGENAPTMVEGKGFDLRHIRYYRLAKIQRRDGELFLTYTRKPDRRASRKTRKAAKPRRSG